jgi:hypothetical protein
VEPEIFRETQSRADDNTQQLMTYLLGQAFGFALGILPTEYELQTLRGNTEHQENPRSS